MNEEDVFSDGETAVVEPSWSSMEWFISRNDVYVDNNDYLREGDAGSVFKGSWKSNEVEVQFMGLDSTDSSRFLQEVAILSQIRHPNIVEFYGANHTGNRFIVNELATNGRLLDFLAQNTQEYLQTKMLYELSLALNCLHSQNVVHNDLRCGNVLVGEDERVKLTGFSRAVIIDETSSMGGHQQNECLRRSKSSEHFANEMTLFADDICSLGICFLEVLIEDFESDTIDSLDDIRDRITRGEIIYRHQPVTEGMWSLIWAMTSTDPRDRVTVASVIEWFRQFDSDTNTEAQSVAAEYVHVEEAIECDTLQLPEKVSDTTKLSEAFPNDQHASETHNDDARKNNYSGSQWDNFKHDAPVIIAGPSSSSTKVCGAADKKRVAVWHLLSNEIEVVGGWSPDHAIGTTYTGKWANASVHITSSDMNGEDFDLRVSRWYCLKHPHIPVLYGSYQIGSTSFFVHEVSPKGSLLEFLSAEHNRHLIWGKLHEASFGLLYLHQRNAVHGNLKTKSFLIGHDGKAKIGGMEQCCSPVSSFDEQAASFPSDIYAFGVFALRVITSRNADCEFSSNHVRNLLAVRPEAISVAQWGLLEKMCDPDSSKRAKIAFVVTQLERFAEPSLYHDGNVKEVQCTNLNESVSPLIGRTIGCSLALTKKRCLEVPGSQWMEEQNVPVHLDHILGQLEALKVNPGEIEAVKFCKLLALIESLLEEHRGSTKACKRATRSLEGADLHNVIFRKLEELFNILNQPNPEGTVKWNQGMMSIVARILQHNPANNTATRQIDESEQYEPVSLVQYGGSYCAKSDDEKQCDLPKPSQWYAPRMEFELEGECIGEGAFAKVYKGTWLHAPVVFKYAGYEEDGGTIADKFFLHEIHVLHQLNHPHIVKFYGANHVGKRYMVLEYAPHGHLRDYLKRGENRASTWVRIFEIACAIQYLHLRDIVHNDLKCNNIVIGANGKAMLIDFGLSSILNIAEILIHPKAMGAVRWRSPEILNNGRPSLASDIYSFAMCMLEAVTGADPWGAMIDAVVKYRVRKGEIPMRPESMSDEQWNLIKMMTTSDPSKRAKIEEVVEKVAQIIKS